MEVEVALDVRAELGEGPIWDDRRQRLLFVDIMRGHVHDFDPTTGAHRVVDAGQPVGAVVLAEDGDWILAASDGFQRMNPESGRTTTIALVEADLPGNRMNDGAVDARGRFWAGTMHLHGEPRRGAVYRLDPDGSVHRMLSKVSISNGLDWSPDNDLLYYVDLPTRRVDVFDFDLDAGRIANRRAFVEIAPEDGYPDGLIVDADGGVWVCLWDGGAVRRYLPDGTLDLEIRVPASQTTKCAFGGADLGDLYITTAWIGLDADARAAQPQAGSLFHVRPGMAGKRVHRYGG